MASLLHEVYINQHSKIGRKIAGTRFMTLILVTFSIFRLRATISREPTPVSYTHLDVYKRQLPDSNPM